MPHQRRRDEKRGKPDIRPTRNQGVGRVVCEEAQRSRHRNDSGGDDVNQQAEPQEIPNVQQPGYNIRSQEPCHFLLELSSIPEGPGRPPRAPFEKCLVIDHPWSVLQKSETLT